jgi:hypothetical protein
MQPKTAAEAFSSKTQSVVLLKKELGETVLNAFLALSVTELVESFNIGKTMNAMQVAFTVEAIKTDYYFLKIEELKFCFTEAKKGRYGIMYDRIDCAVICEWIGKYLETRMELSYKHNIEEQKKYITGENKIGEVLVKMNVEFKVDAKKIEKKIPRALTEQEILINNILKEFDIIFSKEEDELFKNGKKKPMGTRFISYKNKTVNQSEYLECRISEITDL